MGVPGADDVMLNYQSTSFHDALYVREPFKLERAPKFGAWLLRTGLIGSDGRLLPGRPALEAPAENGSLRHNLEGFSIHYGCSESPAGCQTAGAGPSR